LRDKLDSFRQRAIKSVCEIAETKDASGKYVFSADSSVNKDRWMVCLFDIDAGCQSLEVTKILPDKLLCENDIKLDFHQLCGADVAFLLEEMNRRISTAAPAFNHAKSC